MISYRCLTSLVGTSNPIDRGRSLQPIHRLKAPIRLDHGEIDLIHSLVVARSIRQRDAIQVEDTDNISVFKLNGDLDATRCPTRVNQPGHTIGVDITARPAR